MALPKIEVPTFELTLPLSKKKITFRPFLVKEQKILLMAAEASDKDTIVRAMKQVLQNCTLTKIAIDTLPIVDIEFYFINLRARSIGEIVELRYKCENEVNEVVCGNIMESSFDLLDVELINVDNYTDVVMINEKVGIKFKHPDLSLFNAIEKDDDYTQLVLEIITNSIEYIFEDEQFYYAKETPKEELLEFLDSLSQEQFLKVEEHFKNLPSLTKKTKITCSKCGFVHDINIEGIDNFFS